MAGCRRRFSPTVPRHVTLLRSSSAGVCSAPALLITYLALMTSLNWRPPDVAVVSADTPTVWRLRWPAPVHFSIRILSAKTPADARMLSTHCAEGTYTASMQCMHEKEAFALQANRRCLRSSHSGLQMLLQCLLC